MTIGNAISFIKRGLMDDALRDKLNGANSGAELQRILDAEHLAFLPHEFEDALNSLLVKCQYEASAAQLKEFQMWWQLLQEYVGAQTCSKQCSGCCH